MPIETVVPICIPLGGAKGPIRGWALLDEEDRALAGHQWSLMNQGYAARFDSETYAATGKRASILMHREIMGVTDPNVQVDHVNRNRLDNRRCNLRVLPKRGLQSQNQGSKYGSTSRHRGVSWDRARRKWRVTGIVNSRRYELGRFDDEEEAAAVAAAFRAKHMPYSEDAA